MLKKKIPIVYMIVAAVLGCVVSVVAVEILNKPKTKSETIANLPTGSKEYNFERLDGYKYVRPIYIAEPKEEGAFFGGVKARIADYVQKVKNRGDIAEASVYVKDFGNDDWMAYNATEMYHPGSLFKVITMISFLRMAETNFNLLQKEVLYPLSAAAIPPQTFEVKKLVKGNKYTIKDLIYNMIVFSDNDATMLLQQNMDNSVFTKVFEDLKLKKPAAVPDERYQLSVKEYSRFVSVLYEVGYLNLPASEMAISLLCESQFSQGITQQLPKETTVAHKVGEAQVGDMMELHETAIVYLNEQPYLVTVMTKGHSSQKLASAMSDLSKTVYDEMAKR